MIYYDVTVPISESMPVWPGDPPLRREWVLRMDGGDELNLSGLCLSSHAGTHVDAPLHFIPDGETVDRLPLTRLVGPAYLVSLEQLAGSSIGVQDLAGAQVPPGTTRLLLKTRNSALWHDPAAGFDPDYVHLGADAARWVVARGIQVVGIDYLSIEGFDAPEHEVHRTLLGAGVVVIEGLNLGQVPAGACQLVCLPLKVEGGDGAPARVLIGRD